LCIFYEKRLKRKERKNEKQISIIFLCSHFSSFL